MFVRKQILTTILTAALLISPNIASAAKKPSGGGSLDTLKQYAAELRKNPSDNALREKIINLALSIKPAPPIPEDAERNFVRGTAFFAKATDGNGYQKAIAEFGAAANSAPWMAIAYYNLGIAQERAGLYAEALQSLKFYLLAAPDAKNAREVKNKIYSLEVDAEDLKAGKNAPAPEPAPAAAPAAPGSKALALAGKPSLAIESADTELKIIKMPPPEKKSRIPSFIGTWYFKDVLRGEELTIEAFAIEKNAAGDLVVTPPKRAADSYAAVTQFEISDKNLKLQMRWKMRSVVGYWKTETYDLTMSDDGKKLSGAHNQKSIGGRNIDMDRVLFRQ